MISTGDAHLTFTLDGYTHLTVKCNDKIVSQDHYDAGSHKIHFGHELMRDLEIKIYKKGAQLLKNKKVSNQHMRINNLTVNGIDCLEGKLGEFKIFDNFYVEDHTLETDELLFDGVWSKKLFYFNYFSDVPYTNVALNKFENTDIALFGASFLESEKVDIENRWFHKVADTLKCTYQIYSVPGGSNQQVFECYKDWQKKCRSKIVIFAPTTFSKLSMCVKGKPTMYDVNKNLKELLKDDVDTVSGKSIRQITDTLFWSGLERVVALQIPLLHNFFSDIDKKSKCYVMPSIFPERNFFSETILNKFLLPEWDYDQSRRNGEGPYPSVLDNQKYFEKLKKQKIIDQMKKYI
jgi:hypothetical protein